MKKGILFLVMGVMAAMQSACMATTMPPQLRTVQPQDQTLNCTELHTEIGYMDNYIYDAQKSLRISGYGGTMSSSQRVARDVTEGNFGVSDSEWERQQAQTQQFNLEKAKARRDHLTQISKSKNCP